ncbi:MAG: hypothetical protein ACO1SV_04775 [Fimbriimonas sp.]
MTTALLTTLLLAPPTLEIRVDGDGYLRLGRGAKTVYATKVALTSVGGALGTADGDILLPRLAVPATAKELKVDLEGNVSAGTANLGRLVLATFPVGTKLTPSGTVFTTTLKASLANPGEGAVGVIRVGKPSAPAAAPTTAKAEGAVTISIRMRSEVESDQFTLGDIAAIDGDPALVSRIAAVGMGPSPMLGTDRGIVAPHLAGRIRMAGIDTKQISLTVPEGAVVARRAQTIAVDQMLDAAREAVRTKLGIDLELVPAKPPAALNVTPGEAEITAEPGAAGTTGIPVTVTVRIAGKLAGTRSFLMVPQGGNTGVRTGETVKVLMICNGATIELEGRAASTGWVGQTVNVTTTAGDKGRTTTLSGTVKAPGVVEVKA